MKRKLLYLIKMVSKNILYGLVIQCLLMSTLMAHDISAQIRPIDKTYIQMERTEGKLLEIFGDIEARSDYRFVYPEEIVEFKSQITVKNQLQSVSDILVDVGLTARLRFKQVDNTIYVAKLNGSEGQSSDEMAIISGKVTDERGDPIPGATILVEGTNNGTATDIDGQYQIDVAEGAVLVFSFIGYNSQRIEVGNQQTINVVLLEDATSLDEVVVIGYGTQKKVNLTGAVSSIDVGKETETRPITSLSSGLSGLAAGLYVNQGSGRPGNDGATLRVRGQGTLNNANPLIIIDGAVGNMNHLNPQDVESISVLKDAASAAIYGSRAANGVILITTKQGAAGEFKVNYNTFFSSAQPSNVVETVSNYADYMELINEGFKNSDPNANPIFSQEKINEWRENEGGDPLKYPNTQWVDEVFQKNIVQNHNLSFSGGSETVKFFGSFGYLDNPGIIERSGYERYTARINLEAEVKPWLTLGTQLNGVVANTDIGTNQIGSVFQYAGASTPGMVLRAPDGRYGGPNNPEDDPQANNVLHNLNSQRGDIKHNKLNSRFYGKLRPIKGLSIEGSFNYTFDDYLEYSQPVFNNRWDFYTNTISRNAVGRTSVRNRNTKYNNYFMDGVVRYEGEVASKLTYNLMAGASQEHYTYSWFQASKYDLIDPALSVLDAATLDAAANGNAAEYAMQSFFGRMNLSWDDKYLFEANIRRDGTSRFAKGSRRWGVFPSFSAGWRISEEDFFNASWLPNLKVRASYGSLGNNAVGNYEYQAVYNAANYVLNNNLFVGFAQTALSNAALTWESTYISNIGLDFDLFDFKFGGSIEAFDKVTKNILIDLPAPLVVGNASIPKQNAAEVQNRGIELNLNYRDQVGEFSYNIGGNFTFVDNRVTRYKGEERTINGSNLIQEGYAINTQYILLTDRLIQTQEDLDMVTQMIADAPIDPSTGNQRNPFAAYGTPTLGDFLYKDTNEDGVINDDDRVTVGHGTAPRVSYGINLGFNWKGFDFSALLQGTSGLHTVWRDIYNTTGVRWGYQINQEIAEGRWYEGRTDATYPRLLNYVDSRNLRASDFWLQNKAYMRLKNVQLGYTIPREITQKFKVETLRVYGSLENYLTFTQYKGFDPEVSGTQYPTLKQALLGLNISF